MTEGIVVGGGIAGVSLAYFLARRGVGDVVVLEREAHPTVHASGRSAATLVELDSLPVLQRLKMLGAQFLRRPDEGFSEQPLIDRHGLLWLFREPEWSRFCGRAAAYRDEGLACELLSSAEANRVVDGVLDETELAGAAFVPDDGFIDVHELVSSYQRHARRAGVSFRYGAEVTELLVEGGRCRGVRLGADVLRGRWVVNAAGAWVGPLAATAGCRRISFSPLRRCLAVFDVEGDLDLRRWPLVWSDPHRVYFRPESGGLLFCPMDEVPTPPCDAVPDDLAIAAGAERLRVLAPGLRLRHLRRSWAGLRTFAPDRLPVVGEDPDVPGLFWLAGQGGCGIETSPALGRMAAELLLDGATSLFDASVLSPLRFPSPAG